MSYLRTHNEEALGFKLKPSESKDHSFYSVLLPLEAGWEACLRQEEDHL